MYKFLAMTNTQSNIIQELVEITGNNIQVVREKFQSKPSNILFARPTSNTWSVADCLEHLCLYGDFYIPVISQFVDTLHKTGSEKQFRAGLVGNYFANSMKIQANGKAKTSMNTFKDKNPIFLPIDKDILDRFMNQQTQYLSILEKSKSVDLNKKGIPITIAQWFKLKLGDALRFSIYHNERHIIQAIRALEKVEKA